MKQIVTKAVVLSRTDYGEADRILTVLTPDQGKLRLMAKGVRRIKSKLAGGIELFSVSDITYLPGRKEIGTLISSRLTTHYGAIAHDIDRTMVAYNLLRRLHKATEDDTDEQYFWVVVHSLAALDAAMPSDLVEAWFLMQLLSLGGHVPNLHTTKDQMPLQDGQRYNFDYGTMSLTPHNEGLITANDIKFLRLLVAVNNPLKLSAVQDVENHTIPMKRLVVGMAAQYIPD